MSSDLSGIASNGGDDDVTDPIKDDLDGDGGISYADRIKKENKHGNKRTQDGPDIQSYIDTEIVDVDTTNAIDEPLTEEKSPQLSTSPGSDDRRTDTGGFDSKLEVNDKTEYDTSAPGHVSKAKSDNVKQQGTSANNSVRHRRFDNPGHAVALEGNDDDNSNNSNNNSNDPPCYRVPPGQRDIPPVRGLSVEEQEPPSDRQMEAETGARYDGGNFTPSSSVSPDSDISVSDATGAVSQNKFHSQRELNESTIPLLKNTADGRDNAGVRMEMQILVNTQTGTQAHTERTDDAGFTNALVDPCREKGPASPVLSQTEARTDNFPDVHGDVSAGSVTVLASQISTEILKNDDVLLQRGVHASDANAGEAIQTPPTHGGCLLDSTPESSGLMDGMADAIKNSTVIIHAGSHAEAEKSKHCEDEGDEDKDRVHETKDLSHGNTDNDADKVMDVAETQNKSSLTTGTSQADVHSSFEGDDVVVNVEAMEQGSPSDEVVSEKEEVTHVGDTDGVQGCEVSPLSPKDGIMNTLAKSALSVAHGDAVEFVEEDNAGTEQPDGAPRADVVEKADHWLVEYVVSCGKKEWTPPLHVRLAENRERVLTQKTVKASGFVVLKNTKRKKIKQLTNFWNNVTYSLALWGRSIRKVEGVHGAGVASYFLFLRWLFGFNIVIFLIMGGFIVVPMALLTETALAPSTDTTYNTSYYCTEAYTVIKGSGISTVLEFIQGSGWMEKTLLFYGYYAVGLDATYNLPLAYVLTIMACLILSLFLMARYTGNSFKDALLTSSNTNFEYSNKVFGAWDYSLTDHNAADLKMRGIAYDIQSEMIEQSFMRKRIARLEKRCSKCWLYFLRLVINFFIVASLGGAAYLIYYVTSWSTEYSASHADASGTDSWLLLLVQYLPSLTITACNALLPIIFEKVVLLEDYAQVFIIKITLVRTVFLRLASLIVLVITLYTEISCTPKDSCNANQEPSCTNIKCWETYVGQQFYKLVVMDFLVAVVKVFAIELPRRFFTSKCNNKILEKIGPPEFNIPSNVLDLVYGECLVWLGFLFSPMLPGVVIVKCFVIFYVKLLSALVACPPTERPYKASRINTFFMVILLVAFFMCSLPVIYTIFSIAPSKGCGPFRVLNAMNEAIKNDVETWPSVLSSTYDFLTSAALTAAIIIVLGVSVYYLRTMVEAHKQKAELYKEQLIMEGRDKQFLLSKFQEMYTPSGKPDKSPRSDNKKKKNDDRVALVDETRGPKNGDIPLQPRNTPPNATDDGDW